MANQMNRAGLRIDHPRWVAALLPFTKKGFNSQSTKVLAMFEFDFPYEYAGLPSADIREDFAGLCFERGQDPQDLLDKLAGYLSSEMLGEFMDDLAMGRI
jgi:hypothetical protein